MPHTLYEAQRWQLCILLVSRFLLQISLTHHSSEGKEKVNDIIGYSNDTTALSAVHPKWHGRDG
jgi:hypothetical protein